MGEDTRQHPPARAGCMHRVLLGAAIVLGVFLTTIIVEMLRPAPLSGDAATAAEEVRRLAPPGSDAAQASNLLSSRGFRCEWLSGTTFSGLAGKHDFVYCDARRTRFPFVSRRWQVAIVHEGRVVTDSRVTTGLVGL